MSSINKPCSNSHYLLAQKLLSASAKGNLEKVSSLLQQGARIAQNKHGRTPLHISCHRGFLDIVMMILKAGCNPDIQDDSGDTPLHRAVAGGHERVVQILLEEACHIDQQNNLGDTVLHEAARCGQNNIIKKLIKSQANVLCKNKNMDLPLHMACANGHAYSVQQLLYASSPASPLNKQKDTPLHLAVRFGHVSCAKLLLTAKCTVDIQNVFGNTPLHIAVMTEQKKMIRVLLDANADAKKIKNKDGKNPVDIAKDLENGELVIMLISGARPTSTRGRTLSRNMNSQRSYSESACMARTKSSSEDCNPDSNLRRSSRRIKTKKKQSTRRSLKKKRAEDKKYSIENHQKSLVVNPYVVPQLYSLYRDEDGSIHQSPVLSQLPNPTPQIVSDLQRSIDQVKLSMEESLNETTSSFCKQIDELRHFTDHRLKALDRMTDERIKAERTLCLHRIEEKSSYDRFVDENKMMDRLKTWVDHRIQRNAMGASVNHPPSSPALNSQINSSQFAFENATRNRALSPAELNPCVSSPGYKSGVDSGVGSSPTLKLSDLPQYDATGENRSHFSCPTTPHSSIFPTPVSYQPSKQSKETSNTTTNQIFHRNSLYFAHPKFSHRSTPQATNKQVASCNDLTYFVPSNDYQATESLGSTKMTPFYSYQESLLSNRLQAIGFGETHAV